MLKKMGLVGGIILLIVIIVSSAGIGRIVGKTSVENYYKGKKTAQFEESQKKFAQSFQSQLPMQVDEVTKLTDVLSVGSSLIYKHTLDITYDQIDIVNFNIDMKKRLLHNVCTLKDMGKVLEKGGVYVYVYMSSDGLAISSYTIKEADCLGID